VIFTISKHSYFFYKPFIPVKCVLNQPNVLLTKQFFLLIWFVLVWFKVKFTVEETINALNLDRGIALLLF